LKTDHGLERFFTPKEIIEFRKLQATTGTIISGSAAVQFFDRTVYEDSDLDLYVQHQSARPIALWLQSIGYVFVPCKDSEFQSLEMGLEKSIKFNPEDIYGIPLDIDDEPDKGYFDAVVVLDFKKLNHPVIQLITSRGPPLEMVLDFHSSEWGLFINSMKKYTHALRPACVMNVITHNRAYSIYPRATFIEQCSLVYNRSEDSMEGWSKYEQQGWIQIPFLEANNYDNPFSSFTRGSQHIGDNKCWTIELDPTISTSQDYMDSNTWYLHYIKPNMGFGMDWRVFVTHHWELVKGEDMFKNIYLMDLVRRDRIWDIVKMLRKVQALDKRQAKFSVIVWLLTIFIQYSRWGIQQKDKTWRWTFTSRRSVCVTYWHRVIAATHFLINYIYCVNK